MLPAALLGAGVGATVGFALLARAVNAHATSQFDGAARKQFPKRRRRATRALATGIGPVGKWWGQAPLAAAAAALAWRSRGPNAAVPIAAASATAAALAWGLEQWMPQRQPPPGRHSPTEPAFPSGHALQTSAVAWTVAWVLSRERLGRRAVTIPVALTIPIMSGLAKAYLDKHWLTDVLGGYLVGAAIAAPAAAGYELARPRRRPRDRAARLRARAKALLR